MMGSRGEMMRSSFSKMSVALRRSATLAVAVCALLLIAPLALGHEDHLPSGFQKTTVFSGFFLPTAARFAPDGRAFVTEKYG